MFMAILFSILISAQTDNLSFDSSYVDSIKTEIHQIDSILDIVRGTPDEWPLMLKKARLLVEIGDTATATLTLNSLMRLPINDTTADRTYMFAAEIAKSDSEKAELLERFGTRYPFAPHRQKALISAAEIFESIGFYERALNIRKILAADYRDGRAEKQKHIARLRLLTGAPKRAVLLAKRFESESPDEMKPLLFKAKLIYGDTVGAFVEAMGISQRPEIREKMMSILLQMGYPEHVVSMASEMTELSPEGRSILAVSLALVGEVELALSHVVQYELFDELDSLGLHDFKEFFEAYRILNEAGPTDSAVSKAINLPDKWPFLRLKADIVSKLIELGSDTLPKALVSPLIEKAYYPKERTLTKIYRWMVEHEEYLDAGRIEAELDKYGYAPHWSVVKLVERYKAYAQRLYEATGDERYAAEVEKWDSIIGRLAEINLEHKGERFDLLLNKVDSLLADGDTAAAWALLKLFEWNGISIDERAAAKMVELAFALRRYEEAETLAANYLEIYHGAPHRDEVFKTFGLVQVALGRFRDALFALYGLVGEDEDATNAFAYSLIKLGYPKAVEGLKGLRPVIRIQAAVASGDLSLAKNLKKLPSNELLLKGYLILLTEHEPERAFRLADSLKVSYIVRAEMAVVYALKKGDFEFAKRNALSAKAFYRIGLAYMRRAKSAEDMDSAMAYLQKAFDMGKLPDAAFKLGSIHFARGNARKAVEFYRIAFQNDTLKPLALYNIGIAFKSLEQTDSAIRYLQAVIDSFGDHELALDAENSLAFLYQDKLSDFDKALRLWHDLEGELLKYDDEVELKYWKAEALLALNRTREALREYLKVMMAKPKGDNWRATAMLKAAKICAILGDTKRAESLLKSLISERGAGDQLAIVAEQELQKLKSEEKP